MAKRQIAERRVHGGASRKLSPERLLDLRAGFYCDDRSCTGSKRRRALRVEGQLEQRSGGVQMNSTWGAGEFFDPGGE